MTDYPSNSKRSKEEPKEAPEKEKAKPVVTSEVVRRRKPLGKRILETFIGGDAGSVWGYVLHDVAIPAAKDMAHDAITQGFERMLFGDVRSRHNSPRPSQRGSSHTSYANRYNQPQIIRRDPAPREISRRGRATHNFDEIILATRIEANEVIDGLFERIRDYQVATIADLYDLVGLSGNWTDSTWGWSDLRDAAVTHVKGGYLLDLPKPEPLD